MINRKRMEEDKPSIPEKEKEEVKEKEVKEVSKPKKVIEPVPEKAVDTVMPLRTYLAISGKKPDQMAGFKYHATKNNLSFGTKSYWDQAYTDFMNTPTV